MADIQKSKYSQYLFVEHRPGNGLFVVPGTGGRVRWHFQPNVLRCSMAIAQKRNEKHPKETRGGVLLGEVNEFWKSLATSVVCNESKRCARFKKTFEFLRCRCCQLDIPMKTDRP